MEREFIKQPNGPFSKARFIMQSGSETQEMQKAIPYPMPKGYELKHEWLTNNETGAFELHLWVDLKEAAPAAAPESPLSHVLVESFNKGIEKIEAQLQAEQDALHRGTEDFKSLEKLTVDQLLTLAAERGVPAKPRMNKIEIINLLLASPKT